MTVTSDFIDDPTVGAAGAMDLSSSRVLEDPPAEERPAKRGMVMHFRLYCFSCGRSTTVDTPLQRPGRCATCGGSMAIEIEPD